MFGATRGLVMGISLISLPADAQRDGVRSHAMNRETDGEWVLVPGASFVTDTPEDGCALAMKLVGHVIHGTQSEPDALNIHRLDVATRPGSSIAASQILAIAFQIIAEVNNYWR
jgi:Hexameric tyrosine-coordinated heme protein (HTHP)